MERTQSSVEIIASLEKRLAYTEAQSTRILAENTHLKQLYDRTPFAYQSLDCNGSLIEINQTWLEALGYTKEEVISRDFGDFLHPDSQNHFKENFPRFKAIGEINGIEFEMVKKDGSTALVSLHGNISKDPDGHFQQTHCVFFDITERKQIEDEREATIEFLRFTNDSRGIEELIQAATAFIQKQSGCEAVGIRLKKENDYPYYETRGFPEEFVLAENWLCARDEAGRPICDSTGNPVLECMCGNVICGRFDPSKPFFTAQGSFWSNCTTELLASTPVADPQSRTRNRCNGEGYESVALIPLQLGTERLGLLQLNDRSKGRFNLETIAMLERLAGDLAVALAKFRAEEKLQALNEELAVRVEERTHALLETQKQYLHAEKLSAIGKLSASIAHEFNNPLQSVMTIVKGIGQYVPLEKDEEKRVPLALHECHRMKDLVANLRDFFQPTSSKLDWVDLHAAIDVLLLISKKDFRSRNIIIVKKYCDDITPVMGVVDQLKQVFLNLFNNAADACEGGGTITITTEIIGGKNIAVHIEDNGIGIDAATFAHIFEPFFTTKPELKGTGLGLSVSYGIIKSHGGRIDVKSESSRGSTFSVFLPIQSVNNEQ
ncbi:MAG: PAS domain S-box-containing protein [Desulforhopalus sp.]|jgi:PAS domain S-box-containing protein